MRQFHELSWGSRYARMGDEAEAKFDQLFPNSAPFGLNRPNVYVPDLPAFIRFMPDRLMHDRLVECKGVGKDQLLKLKVDALDVLMEWGDHLMVQVFVWDSFNKRWSLTPIDYIEGPADLCEIKKFPEGTPYYPIPLDAISTSWHDEA